MTKTDTHTHTHTHTCLLKLITIITALLTILTIPICAHAAATDWPGTAQSEDITGDQAQTHVNLKIDDSKLSFTAPTIINYCLDGAGSFITPEPGVAYFKNNSIFNIKVNSYDVTAQSGAKGVADLTGETGVDTWMLNVAGSDNIKYPFAVDSPSNWTGWVMQKTGVTGDTCGLTFSDGKMINPTASKWHNGASLESVEWNISSEAGDDLCNVSFDSMGGSAVPDSVVKKGGTISAPTEPTKADYEFDGWYSDPTCTTPFNFSNPINTYTNIFAKWAPRTPYAVVLSSGETNAVDDLLEFRYDAHRGDYPADHTFDCEDTGTTDPGWSAFHSGTGSSQTLTTANFTKDFTDNVKPKSCYHWFFSNAPYSKLSKFNNIKNLDMSECANVTMMFYFVGTDSSVPEIDIDCSGWNLCNITDLTRMFYYVGHYFSSVKIDCSNWNVENVTNVESMFSQMTTWSTGEMSDSEININLANWNCAKLESTFQMFWGIDHHGKKNAKKIININCAGWGQYTYNLKSTKEMFGSNSKAWEDSPNSVLTIDGISDWNTSSLQNVEYMFANCPNLKFIDLSKWNISNVETMGSMFNDCIHLESINILNWYTTNPTTTAYMFTNCNNLKYIYCNKDWSQLPNLTNSTAMFSNCEKLPHFDSSKTDKTYAYPDNGETGYFTPIIELEQNNTENNLVDFVDNTNDKLLTIIRNIFAIKD